MRTEINQKAKPHASRPQVIEDLCAMIVGEFGHGFRLDDDFVVADEVSAVNVFQDAALVGDLKVPLAHQRNSSVAELNF